MKGIHDLGGHHGYGAINPEPETEEPVFHAEWERRVFALTLATGMLGQWTIDESRYARERVPPLTYLQKSYYETWLAALEQLISEKGLLTERGQWQAHVPGPKLAKKLLATGGPTDRDSDTAPEFCVGAKVRVRKIQTRGHTRAPGYVQGTTGTIAAHYGAHVIPDASALGEQRGEHLYSVAFVAAELWGQEAEASEIMVDLWESYLEGPE
ncbi:MAG: nitrile hydratase subunit beta [Gammaproteobacteria bacterium]|nr:nitrile hydratase subunit beta [Gammaproteobacteria bacterium]